MSALTKTFLFSAAVFWTLWQSASASSITINSGSTLLVSGGDLTLNCNDFNVIVNTGGILTVNGGEVRNLNLKLLPGGTYSKAGGSVTECDTFYIIKTPNGAVILSL